LEIAMNPGTTHRMTRPAAVAIAALALIALPATVASARGGGSGWQPVTGLPDEATVHCGASSLTISFPVNREFARTVSGDGELVDHVVEFTGSLFVRFTTSTGRSVTVNASGPGRVITYTNGDVETHSEGWFNFAFDTAQQAQQLGLPQIVSTSGLMDYITHGDGLLTPVRIPNHVVDICTELGLG
jgi:hypothetical protein